MPFQLKIKALERNISDECYRFDSIHKINYFRPKEQNGARKSDRKKAVLAYFLEAIWGKNIKYVTSIKLFVIEN